MPHALRQVLFHQHCSITKFSGAGLAYVEELQLFVAHLPPPSLQACVRHSLRACKAQGYRGCHWDAKTVETDLQAYTAFNMALLVSHAVKLAQQLGNTWCNWSTPRSSR